MSEEKGKELIRRGNEAYHSKNYEEVELFRLHRL